MKVSKRQIQKENTHQKVISTAYRVFSEKGFSTPTKDIAKEAGIAHGSVFSHFATQKDLLTSLLQDFGDVMGRELHGLSEKKTDIRDFLDMYLDILLEHEDFYSKLICELSLLPEEAKYTFITIQTTAAFHFSNAMEDEIKKGNIKNIPPHLLFHTWLGLVHHYLQNKEFFAPEGSVIERYRLELIDTYLKLIENNRR